MTGERLYNAPPGSPSDIGDVQFNEFFYQKKALIEAVKESYFGQLADTVSMPKHFGKKIKRYHYLPLLDDANINDQGIDANGAIVNQKVAIPVTNENGELPVINSEDVQIGTGNTAYFIGEGATAALAAEAAAAAAILWMEGATVGGGLGLTLVGGTDDLKFYDGINDSDGLAYALGYRFPGLDSTASSAAEIVARDALAVPNTGNLYGSSKDVGTIAAKLPLLSETGGRVNRVGFRRIELEGTLQKYGFFDEYSQESLDFDTDAELAMHINREMVSGANEITEDKLQIDLLNAAGIIRYTGDATSHATIHGEAANTSVPVYNDLMRLSIDLDNTRTPKGTKMVTGSRMIDTKTVQGARIMYAGSEMEPTLRKMTDTFSNQAFIGVEKYASAGSVARGEIGQVGQFKIVIVPEMMHWAGEGASVTTNSGYRETGGKYDVYPLLVVGSESFTTVGFQTDGKSVKFRIKHVKPGSAHSYHFDDPYGEMGFMSIKWYYGFMVLRPERIALVKCVAEW